MKLQKFDYEMKDNAKKNRTSKIIIVITIVLAAFVIYKTYALFQVSTDSYAIAHAVVGDFSTTPGSCFTIDSDGQITEYDVATCGKDVKIPSTINGTQVKSIDTNAFKSAPGIIETTTFKSETWDDTLETNAYIVFSNSDFDTPLYAVAYDEETKNNFTTIAATAGFDVPIYLVGTDTIPEKQVGEGIQYYHVGGSTTDDLKNLEIKILEAGTAYTLAIDTLDLSKTIYLNKIEEFAFTTYTVDDDDNYTFTDGLDGLEFGDNDAAIFIEKYAFAKINVDTLTLHSSLYANYGDISVALGGETTGAQFASGTIGTLNIKYDEGNKKFFMGYFPLLMANVSNINVGEGIEEIGDYGLSTADGSITLSLPSTIKTLDQFAFAGDEIISLNLPNGLVSIGDDCFNTLDSISELVIPDTVTTIGEFAFRSLKSVTNFQMSSNIVSIGKGAFQKLATVNDFTLPATLTTVGDRAFEKLTSATTVTIKQADASGITAGSNWLGSATIVYEP